MLDAKYDIQDLYKFLSSITLHKSRLKKLDSIVKFLVYNKTVSFIKCNCIFKKKSGIFILDVSIFCDNYYLIELLKIGGE